MGSIELVVSIASLLFATGALAACYMVGIRSRAAIRSLWQRCENLQTQIQGTRIAMQQGLNHAFATIASQHHQRKIDFTSQHGEDIFLWEYFGRKDKGICVEVGAFDGKTCSNTFAFESLGWNCILIEPDPDMVEMARQNRPHSTVIQAAVGGAKVSGTIEFSQVRTKDDWAGMLSFTKADPLHLAKCEALGATITKVHVPTLPLSKILENVAAPIDFISIDVEGLELEVLDGLDFHRFAPKLILAELTYDRNEDRVGKYLADKGYRRIAELGCNGIYERT